MQEAVVLIELLIGVRLDFSGPSLIIQQAEYSCEIYVQKPKPNSTGSSTAFSVYLHKKETIESQYWMLHTAHPFNTHQTTPKE